jgi:hypothetical protein
MKKKSLRAHQRVARLAFVAFALISLATTLSLSRASAQGEKSTKVNDSILGVRVGATLDEVHALLKPLGTYGGRATNDGGRKEAWTLKETNFKSIAYKTNNSGRIVWVTGWLRTGREIPFKELGELEQATAQDEATAVWNVKTPEREIRLLAKGSAGKAHVVSLLLLSARLIN